MIGYQDGRCGREEAGTSIPLKAFHEEAACGVTGPQRGLPGAGSHLEAVFAYLWPTEGRGRENVTAHVLEMRNKQPDLPVRPN